MLLCRTQTGCRALVLAARRCLVLEATLWGGNGGVHLIGGGPVGAHDVEASISSDRDVRLLAFLSVEYVGQASRTEADSSTREVSSAERARDVVFFD